MAAAEERLARYKVSGSVGRGSYGEVFLVTHRGDGKKYVMKKIKLTSSSARERLAAEQEASLLSRLKHPNIVSYRESFQDSSSVLHIVMGYCEGGDLSSRLKARRGRLLPERQVVEWFVQIALALQYLHERNILHRDLKTQNIFLSRKDLIKVGDLGIARVLEGSCDLAETVVGTPYYMSPELFSNKPYNHKSDIWALGCCVYEMATLRPPFSAHNINSLMVKIMRGQTPVLPQQFSRDLSGLVALMLSQDASNRPSVHQLLRRDYIRTHIKLFLERAAGRKRTKARPQLEGWQQEISSPSPAPQGLPALSEDVPSRLSLARERRRQHRQDIVGRKGHTEREEPAVVNGESPECEVPVSSSSSSLEEDGPERRDGEVEEFYTLLDSTLHQEKDECTVVAGAEAAGDEKTVLQPGRLQERIAALRRECDSGLGEDMASEALSTLDMLDPENDPVRAAIFHAHPSLPPSLSLPLSLPPSLPPSLSPSLSPSLPPSLPPSLSLALKDMQLLLPLLGYRRHELYASKLRQLWLCEDSLREQ